MTCNMLCCQLLDLCMQGDAPNVWRWSAKAAAGPSLKPLGFTDLKHAASDRAEESSFVKAACQGWADIVLYQAVAVETSVVCIRLDLVQHLELYYIYTEPCRPALLLASSLVLQLASSTLYLSWPHRTPRPRFVLYPLPPSLLALRSV